MILRRITQHVKNQDWFAVFLDFVIVVVGVFIGIQVSNWNLARVAAASERQYLERLHEEVVTIIEQREAIDQNRKSRLDKLLDVTEILYGRAELRPFSDAECRAIGSAHIRARGETDLPTVDELLSAGRLEIIGSPQIRSALVRYRQVLNRSNKLIDSMNTSDVVLPRQYRDLFVRAIEPDDLTGEDLQVSFACDSEAMRGNPDFLGDFAGGLDRYQAYVQVGIIQVTEQLQRLHGEVDAALNFEHAGDSL